MSPSASEVSVVTVNWNGRHHLGNLLPSLQRLDCREIIVVDNGSHDGSQQFVRSQAKTRLIENQTNQGFAHPCNQGARAAHGRYVAFINNDMRVDPAWLDEALPSLNQETVCVASRILDWEGQRIDFNGSSMQYLGFALQRDMGRLLEEVSHQDEQILFPCGGAMIVDKEVFLGLGGFDADYFAVYEDVDFGWRLWLSGYQVALAPRSLVYHRSHGTFQQHGQEKLRYLMHRNALMTIIKNYEDDLLERILPLAVRLSIKRTLLLSGVRKESFYLWSQARHELRSGDPLVQDRWIDALNHLTALDDVFQSMPQLMEKRRKVQAARRREDAEILQLFVDPLRSIVEEAEYQEEESNWLQALDLAPLLKAASAGSEGASVPSEATKGRRRTRLNLLEQEMKRAQWLAGHAAQRPPAPEKPGLRQVLRSLKQDGLRSTWSKIARRIGRTRDNPEQRRNDAGG